MRCGACPRCFPIVTPVAFLDVLRTSVTDPYHFDTDPDPGCEKNRYGSGSRVNFDTDPDPGRTLIRIRIQGKRCR